MISSGLRKGAKVSALTSEGITAVSVAPTTVARKVSNSETTTWLQCQRRYLYQYDLNLRPKKLSQALSRGILGHEVVAEYYSARKAGQNHADALVQARRLLYAKPDYDLDIVAEVDKIVNNYFRVYGDEIGSKYSILAVEEQYEIPLTSDFIFVMRLDLLVKNLKTNRTELWDHKFVYDFWSQDDLALDPQRPKYIGALRFNNNFVDEAVLNQLRYRSIKQPTDDQLFKRTVQQPSQAKINTVLREHVQASREIVEWRKLSLDERRRVAKRSANKMTCRSCSVKQLCMSELDGGDISYAIKTDYVTNEYGYNNNPTDEL